MTDITAGGQQGVIADGARTDGAVRDYILLLKPRVMSLVVFTGIAGLVVAPGSIHPFLAFVAVLCIAVAAGAAGAINMWFDRDIDALMRRTAARPIPMGRVAADDALAFGVVLTIGSVLLMGIAVNWAAAALLAGANLFYVFVYTIWLKRRTPQNIVIGGAAGAFPPVIGWAAVTGDAPFAAWVLFLVIFMWTPPHFWALALFRREDYATAGVPMLPVVAGERATRVQILIYSMVLAPLAMIPSFIGTAGILYGAGAGLLGVSFVWRAIQVWRDTDPRHPAARRLFGFSILYLFAIFLLLIVDQGAMRLWELMGSP